MARYNTNRYQYETSPRKLQPEYVPIKKKYPKKSTAKKTDVKSNQRIQTSNNINKKIILYIGIAFVVLFAISYRNALIAQTYSQVKELKSELSEVEKDNRQLEVNIESKTNLSSIEKKAQEELGLKKLEESQKVYISLDKQDYIESSVESVKLDETTWLQEIINKIKNIF